MKAVVAAVMGVHGMVHLLGFFAAFVFARVPEMKMTITRGAGVLWLVACLLFLAASAMVATAPRYWWLPALAGLLLSQALIVDVWRDAKFGSLVNLALIAPIGFALLSNLPGGLSARYQQALAAAPPPAPTGVIADSELAPLPPPVQNWLRRVGVVGRPAVTHVRARFRGQIRAKVDGRWMPFTATQDDWFATPRRVFFLESSMFGIPFEALHVYADGAATMRVKAAAVATMVDAEGAELSRSETVTMLNDMCVLAPSSLLRAAVEWAAIDATHARVTLRAHGHRVSGVLTFDAAGDLVDFTSDDRLQTEDGVAYHAFPWTTPLSAHRDFSGVRLPQHGDARWLMPAGPLVYGQFDLVSLDGAP